MTTAGHEHKTYVLANTESTSFTAIAQALSSTLGKEIRYQSPPVEAFRATLAQVGVPEVYIGLFTEWAGAVAQGMLEIADVTLESFLGRKLTTTTQFIAQVYK